MVVEPGVDEHLKEVDGRVVLFDVTGPSLLIVIYIVLKK